MLFIKRRRHIINRDFFYSSLLTGLAFLGMLIGNCIKAPPHKATSEKESIIEVRESQELRKIIQIKATGAALRYQRESLWAEKDFSEIVKSKEKFKSNEINSFKKYLERYNRYALNPEIKFDGARKSTVLLCDIKGARYGSDSYEFHWLLGDLPFDLYQFRQSKKELNYEGRINGVPTTIRLVFPYTIAHCHEHVWPM